MALWFHGLWRVERHRRKGKEGDRGNRHILGTERQHETKRKGRQETGREAKTKTQRDRGPERQGFRQAWQPGHSGTFREPCHFQVLLGKR